MLYILRTLISLLMTWVASLPDVVFVPVRVLTEYPYLSFIPSALFLILHTVFKEFSPAGLRLQRYVLLCSGIAWGLYGIYELAMREWSKTVVAPIRVDLLLVTPLLYLSTLLGAIALGSMLYSLASAAK